MSEIKYAEESNQFRDMLILHLDALTIMYRDLIEKNADSKYILNDNELLNKTLAEMFVIMDQLLPKLIGAGDKAKKIVEALEPFKKWKLEPLVVKQNMNERKKIHMLWSLILQAYDVLGFSNY